MSTPSRLDLESRLFGVLQTLKTVHTDIKNGKLSYSSYCSIVRKKIKDLMLIELTFQAKGLKMDTILDDMMLSEEYFQLIPQIQEFITLSERKEKIDNSIPAMENEGELEELTKNKTTMIGNVQIHPIKLANLASTITGNFITIFDFFKLELTDPQLLHDSFHQLENALKEFPGLENLYLDFMSLTRKVTGDKSTHDDNDELYHSFEKLYRRYLAFLKNPSNM